MTYREAIDYLYNARPPFHIVGSDAYKPGLENTLRLMAHVGNPHEHLRAVHVAGTNGKGSTCHLIAAVLQAAGLKVGLYTSPHLVDLRERIRINGEPIPEAGVAGFIERNRAFLDETQPSFFETMTAMAFAYFAEEKVDIAVIETGLGGRLDSTNVLTPLLSVITNIGMDHTEFLGNTLTRIAREKAGIIKPGVPTVIGETHPQTINVFMDRARECGILGDGLETTDCRIWFADQCGYMRSRRLREAPVCELKGEYQDKNLQTAYVALQVLRNCVPSPILRTSHIRPSYIQEGFAHVCSLTGLRGRWETLQEQPLIICDTGHNSHGLQYIAHQLKGLRNPRIWIIFGMVNDKDTDVVLRLMPKGERYRYIFTTPDTLRARSAGEMYAMWNAFHSNEGMEAGSAIAIPEPQEAFNYALRHASPEDAVFIGGSNYLVGEILKYRDSGNPEIQQFINE
ncbi:MAG: bifunctional folylpolyglutamate synthase/dihydrofolate synthase [Paludibacteraceae bacterium]|nr:bifunctional folylpolyglutamate synthase/dihydrofolate synthase [Paludibacteraceae bacterium]